LGGGGVTGPFLSSSEGSFTCHEHQLHDEPFMNFQSCVLVLFELKISVNVQNALSYIKIGFKKSRKVF